MESMKTEEVSRKILMAANKELVKQHSPAFRDCWQNKPDVQTRAGFKISESLSFITRTLDDDDKLKEEVSIAVTTAPYH